MGEVALNWRELYFSWPESGFSIAPPDMQLQAGSSLFIHGASGCGKSTLLSLISGVVPAKRGCLEILGVEIARLSQAQRDRFRGENMGVVFQQFNLIPYLDVMSNVLMPTRMFPKRLARSVAQHGSAKAQATELFESLGIASSIWAQGVHQLSVGQQQRVAVARALMGYPSIIIADEPTSALDEANKNEFLHLLLSVARKMGTTVILVSHDMRIADSFDQVLTLQAQGSIRAVA
jgi:putative ABC transport system ATP-binding protein